MTSLSDKPTLVGERVTLRPFTVADTEAMLEIISDPDVQRFTGSVISSTQLGAAMPIDQARDWYGSRSTQDDRLDLAVVDRASGAVVGEVVLNEWDPDTRSVNFRTLIGPAGRDRGLGTEATRLVLAHAFEALGLHRVSLEVLDFNPRARRVYAKVGFVHEGTRRQVLRFDDEWVDAHDLAILETEWPAHRGHPGA